MRPVVEWDSDARLRLTSPLGHFRRVAAFLVILFVYVAALGAFPVMHSAAGAENAEDSSSETVNSITNNITDIENLLGTNIGKVSDAIDEVKTKTGVTLNLLYLPTFDSTQKPATWASKHLESMNPQKNTVMLAVASEDGNLAVVVSKNSDQWLRTQETVDSLSDAAVAPIVNSKSGTPDWSGSAIALAQQIEAEKSESESAPSRVISIVVLIAVLVLIVAVAGIFFVRHLHRRARGRKHTKVSHVQRKKHEKKSESQPSA